MNKIFGPPSPSRADIRTYRAAFGQPKIGTQLKRHINSVQKILGPSEVNSCEKCDKSFDQKVHLQIYTHSDHENNRYPCNKCNKSIDQKANLQRHI